MHGYLTYGWMLYQNVTSRTNPWTKTIFATAFISWLISLIGLLFFTVKFWREKDHKQDEARVLLQVFQKK